MIIYHALHQKRVKKHSQKHTAINAPKINILINQRIKKSEALVYEAGRAKIGQINTNRTKKHR